MRSPLLQQPPGRLASRCALGRKWERRLGGVLAPGDLLAVGEGVPPKDLVARAGIEPGTVRAGKGDAHASLVTRFGNDATQSASGVKHLYPHVTGDERPPFLIHRQTVTATVRLVRRGAQFHVTLAR